MHNRGELFPLGMQDQEDDHLGAGGALTPSTKPDGLLREFALALGRELDRIGYPAPPARTNHLSNDLGLGRMQAYRIGRGENMPTLPSLLKLQALGVSIDTVLNELQENREEVYEVVVPVLGHPMKAAVLPSRTATGLVVARREGQAVLRRVSSALPASADELHVGGLRFIGTQASVAVVEDDEATLAVLCGQIEPAFNVQAYKDGFALFPDGDRLAAFDALVLDWRLPDIEGADLVARIREQSRAPIIVITGVPQANHAISEVLQLQNVYYAAKPVDEHILRAMLAKAIEGAGERPPAAATMR